MHKLIYVKGPISLKSYHALERLGYKVIFSQGPKRLVKRENKIKLD